MLARIATTAAAALVASGIGWGQWLATEEAKLTASDAEAGDQLGSSVVISGDTAVVGAPMDTNGSGPYRECAGLAFDPGAGVLYATDMEIHRLLRIDPASGAVTMVGGTVGYFIEGLAFDPVTGILYGSDTFTAALYVLDTTTGYPTKIGNIGFGQVSGLALDPLTGKLYGSDPVADQLIAIDPATGAGTAIGPLGFKEVHGLEFDPVTGTLYGTDLKSDKLIVIDTATGQGTAVGQLGFAEVRGLAFDSVTARLVGIDAASYGLIAIDAATGAGTAIATLSGPQLMAGAAYVYGRNGASWVEQGKLTASDPAHFGMLGQSAAIAGETLVVGASGVPHPWGDYGAGYVFERTGATWVEQAKLSPENNPNLWASNFGASVAISGDTVLVGDPLANDWYGAWAGAVWVFVRSGTGWSLQQVLTTSDAMNGDDFGISVAIAGDTALVGAYHDAHAPGAFGDPMYSEGSAYVFVRSGSIWKEKARLTASNASTGDDFGMSVALSGGRALIGAPDAGILNNGMAYVFERTGAGWIEQAILQPGSGAIGVLEFGTSVDLTNGLALVGAPYSWTTPYVGSAYLFGRSGTSWNEQAKLTASDGQDWDAFGVAVSLEDDAALLGAFGDDHQSAEDTGSAYVFRLSPGPPETYCTAGLSASGCAASIAAIGTASATAPTGFFLTASGGEGARNGLFLYGTDGRQANPWGNGTSLQCVVPPTQGGGLLVGSGTSGACDGSFSQDLNALWCPTCPKPAKNPSFGAIVQAQLWYRDPLSTSNQTTSLSDAIEFVVGP